MKKNYLHSFFVFLFLTFSFQSFSQDWGWVATAGGNMSDKALDIDVDRYGNQYVCGYYNTGSSANDVSFGAVHPGLDFGKEGFLAKIDSSGTWNWVRSAFGGWDERTLGLCVDNVNDFVYVTGTAWYNTNFGSCTSATFPGGGDEIFVGKFDLSGTCQWLLGAGGSSDDHGYDLVTDKQGNIYLTGFIGDTYASGGYIAHFGSINVPIPNPGDSLGFLAKISSGGSFQWVRTFEATDGERDNRIAIDSNAYIYVTGGFRGTAQFGSFTGVSKGGRDIFVLKYDSFGNQQWLNTAGGILDDRANSVAVDFEQDVYITGELRDKVVFGTDTVDNNGSPNGRDIFVAKLTANGSWVWAKKAGSDRGSDRGNRIVSNKQKLLFVTGEFLGDAAFGAADTLWNPDDSVQVFVAAIDTTGKWQWAIQAGGAVEDRGTGLAIDDDCNLFTCGFYEQTATFGGAGSITAIAKREIFTTKIPGACDYMLSVNNDKPFQNLSYYPNPNTGSFTIELGSVIDDVEIEVHNVVGQLVNRSEHHTVSKVEMTLDQPNGIYFVKVLSKGTNAKVFKVIKEQ